MVIHTAYGLGGPRFKPYFDRTLTQGLKILGKKLHDNHLVPWCLSYGPCLMPKYKKEFKMPVNPLIWFVGENFFKRSFHQFTLFYDSIVKIFEGAEQ